MTIVRKTPDIRIPRKPGAERPQQTPCYDNSPDESEDARERAIREGRIKPPTKAD